MGLDMYLFRVPKADSLDDVSKMETRLSKAFYKNKLDKELLKIQEEKGYKNPLEYSIKEWISSEEKYKEFNKEGHCPKVSLYKEIGYWRKFNALHSWFVKNVQEGIDDCGCYIVDIEQLQELLFGLANINKDNAEEVLPTAAGFFFGGTEYDEYYFQEVEKLKLFIMNLVEEHERNPDTKLIYSSSW